MNYELRNLKIQIMSERVELKSLGELRKLLEQVRELYEEADGPPIGILGPDGLILGPDGLTMSKPGKGKGETADKIRLLEMIGEIENKIRGEEYKERVLNGEA
jgi:hypothetical protein